MTHWLDTELNLILSSDRWAIGNWFHFFCIGLQRSSSARVIFFSRTKKSWHWKMVTRHRQSSCPVLTEGSLSGQHTSAHHFKPLAQDRLVSDLYILNFQVCKLKVLKF